LIDAAVKAVQEGSTNYCTRVVSDLTEIGAERWNAVLSHEAANPFVRYEFLRALQASGCAAGRTGWEPHHLTLWSGAELKAAAPLYRKHHSYGEYVFDWAWADAHQRHGIDYYPKWLVAVPFTPVPGPRLLAVPERRVGHPDLLRRARRKEHAVEGNLADLGVGKNVPVKLRLFYIDKGILCTLRNIFKYETCLLLHHILLVATKELHRE